MDEFNKNIEIDKKAGLTNYPYNNPATFADGMVQFPICASGLVYPYTWIAPADFLKVLHDCNFNISLVSEIAVGSLETSLQNAINEHVKILTWYVNFFTDTNRLPKDGYGVEVNIGPYGEGFAGINLCDEPSPKIIDGSTVFKYGKTLLELYENIKDDQNVKYLVYINLNASLPKEYEGTYTYFLNQYQTKFKPSFFCYDLYPIQEIVKLIYEGIPLNQSVNRQEGEILDSEEFYTKLETFHNFCSNVNRPFWAFCQSKSFMTLGDIIIYRPLALEQFLRYEAFSALAYGAKGIVYWSYCMSETQPTESYFSALLNRRNEKTASWYYAQKVNAEIQKYKDIFLNADLVEVKIVKTYSYTPGSDNYKLTVEEVNGSNQIVVSRFETTTNSYILIVNKDSRYYTEININLYVGPLVIATPSIELTPIKSNGEENQVLNSGDNARILPPGGYRILRVPNAIYEGGGPIG